MIRITLLAEQNCVLSGLAASTEFFNLCNIFLPHLEGSVQESYFHTEIVTVNGKRVSSFGGIPIQPSRSIREVQKTDLILIPSFQPTVVPLQSISERILEWIEHHYKKHAKIAAISAGAFVLAETGLLNHKKATTNWLFLREFKSRYPEVRLQPQQIITEDSGLICTASNNFTADLCAYFIKQMGFHELAAKFSKGMMLHPSWEHQSPWTIFGIQKNHNDREILQAQEWMEENHAEVGYIDAIAEQFSISPRHFKRRFKKATGDAPLTYLQRLRVEAAKCKLESTQDTIDEITWLVGYEDINSFRRLFKKHTGLSPRAYRTRFSNTNDVNLS